MNDEFKFEREIRLDEERIASYFAELPSFIDLPGENEAIFERIARNENVKVSSIEENGNLRHVAPAWNSEEDPEDIDDDELSFHLEYDDIPRMLDSLCIILSEYFAANNSVELEKAYLPLLCQCSKTIARISDTLFAVSDGHAMQTALAKRSLSDINDFAAMLQRSNIPDADQMLDIIRIIRSKILDIIFKLQKN